MNNICKKLMKHSVIQHNLTIPIIYSCKQRYVNFSQDTPVHETECCDKRYAVTLQSQNFNNVQRNVITNTSLQSDDMTIKGAIKMINLLYIKFMAKDSIYFNNVKNTHTFTCLCDTIFKNARCLHIKEIVHILRTLLYYEVSVNTNVIQILLQLTRNYINELSLQQIIATYYTLSRIDQQPLVTALLIALPNVFRERARLELNKECTNLETILKFCIHINDMETGKYIILLLNEQRRINMYYIVTITHALYLLQQFSAHSTKLSYKVQSKILNNVDTLCYKQIETLLYYNSKCAKETNSQLYKEDVVNALFYALASKGGTLQSYIHILKQLNKMQYSSIALLDIIARQCLKNPDSLRSCKFSEVISFIEGFTIANYIPCYWELIKPVLTNYVANIDYPLYDGIFVTFLLLSLNCYSKELIEKTFTLFNMVAVHPEMNQIALIALKLHWCLKLLYPAYNGIMIDEKRLQHIKIEPVRSRTSSVMESLIEAVGSNKYVKPDLQTKFGQLVDYVVVFQPNGTPMNVSHYNNFKFVEELESLPNCTKILFFAFEKNKYSVNMRNLASTVEIQLRAIQTLPGFYSFTINPYMWEVFSKKDKVQHLQKAIKSCETDTIINV